MRAHARRAEGARWQVSGRVAAGDGTTGAAAARAVRSRRPGTLLPHRRDREAVLHRGDPRRDHGHRSGGAREDRALCVPQTRPRRPAECGSRPEQAGRDGSVCSAGNYRTQMWDKQKEVFLPSTPGLGMHVEVKDPEGKVGPRWSCSGYGAGGLQPPQGRASPELSGPCGAQDRAACTWGLSRCVPLQVVLSRQYGSDGRFTFTSHTPGDHQICLHSNSTRMALFAGGRLVRGLPPRPQLRIPPLIPASFELTATVLWDTLGHSHNQRDGVAFLSHSQGRE